MAKNETEYKENLEEEREEEGGSGRRWGGGLPKCKEAPAKGRSADHKLSFMTDDGKNNSSWDKAARTLRVAPVPGVMVARPRLAVEWVPGVHSVGAREGVVMRLGVLAMTPVLSVSQVCLS